MQRVSGRCWSNEFEKDGSCDTNHGLDRPGEEWQDLPALIVISGFQISEELRRWSGIFMIRREAGIFFRQK